MGVGLGVRVGVGVGDAVGDGDGDGVERGLGVGVGDGVAVGWLGSGGPPGPPLSGRTATSATADAMMRERMVSWMPIPGGEARTIGSDEGRRNMVP